MLDSCCAPLPRCSQPHCPGLSLPCALASVLLFMIVCWLCVGCVLAVSCVLPLSWSCLAYVLPLSRCSCLSLAALSCLCLAHTDTTRMHCPVLLHASLSLESKLACAKQHVLNAYLRHVNHPSECQGHPMVQAPCHKSVDARHSISTV